jgi:hypothetical protein
VAQGVYRCKEPGRSKKSLEKISVFLSPGWCGPVGSKGVEGKVGFMGYVCCGHVVTGSLLSVLTSHHYGK